MEHEFEFEGMHTVVREERGGRFYAATVNGLKWDFSQWGAQFAQTSCEEAASLLWDKACETHVQ